MDTDHPTITSRRPVFQCPWFSIVSKGVSFLGSDGMAVVSDYLALECPDFVSVCARTSSGKFVLVRQYRPVVESYTWEFPAGTVDAGESPRTAAVRELYEETGYRVSQVSEIGTYRPDLGRLSNTVHYFYADVSDQNEDWVPETGIQSGVFLASEIDDMVVSGELACVQHVALWLLATKYGLV